MFNLVTGILIPAMHCFVLFLFVFLMVTECVQCLKMSLYIHKELKVIVKSQVPHPTACLALKYDGFSCVRLIYIWFNAVLHLDSAPITFAKGERVTEIEADSARRSRLTVCLFFFLLLQTRVHRWAKTPHGEK